MGSSSAPKTPDYAAQAVVQGQNDKNIAQYLTQANRPTQIDPYSTTTWTQNANPTDKAAADAAKTQLDYLTNLKTKNNWSGQIDQAIAAQQAIVDKGYADAPWTQTTTLNPQQQALLDQQIGIQGTQNSRIADLLKNFQTPTLASTPGLQKAQPNDIANLLYQQSTHNLDKRFATDEAATRASLASQGFQQGSEGYNNSINDFNTNKNDTYQQAQTAASLGGYQQANTENAQNLQDYLGQSSANLNNYNSQMGYLSSLLGGVQGPAQSSYPSFAPASGFQSPDLTGAQQATYQGNLNQTNAQNAQKSSTLGTIGTVATAAAIAY